MQKSIECMTQLKQSNSRCMDWKQQITKSVSTHTQTLHSEFCHCWQWYQIHYQSICFLLWHKNIKMKYCSNVIGYLRHYKHGCFAAISLACCYLPVQTTKACHLRCWMVGIESVEEQSICMNRQRLFTNKPHCQIRSRLKWWLNIGC